MDEGRRFTALDLALIGAGMWATIFCGLHWLIGWPA